MPFINQGNNPDNEFFSDGITEDIHTHLAKINSLNVIAHSAMMLYKNSEKSIKQIGKELNVSTILKGSVRRVGDKIRIYAELIDAGTSKISGQRHLTVSMLRYLIYKVRSPSQSPKNGDKYFSS